MSKRTDVESLVGARFGMWCIVDLAKSNNNKTMVRCVCDCGTYKDVNLQNILRGLSTGCGCRAREENRKKMTTHGETSTKLHGVWTTMKNRCNNPNVKSYKDYGGRGIKVCSEWESFESFSAWAKANGYEEGLELNRLDNDGDYSPQNCRWDTKVVNMNNTRRTKRYIYNGKEYTVRELADISGLKPHLIYSRLKRGWSAEDAIVYEPIVGNNQNLRRK